MTDRELMQQALDALIDAADSQNWEMQQNIDQHGEWYRRSVYLKQATAKSQETIEALRAALAQPEPEPVAWMYEYGTDNGDAVNKVHWYKNVSLTPPVLTYNRDVVPLYPAPPQREWQGLTDEEIKKEQHHIDWTSAHTYAKFARAIEAKLKEKNT